MRHCFRLLLPLRLRFRRTSEFLGARAGRALPRTPSILALLAALRRVVQPSVPLHCLAILASCAAVAPPPHPLDTAGPEYTVAVIPVPYAPGSDFGGTTQGETRAMGAAKGAGAGALAGGVLVGIGAIVFPPLGVPLGLALTPYLTAGGAIAGYAGSAAGTTARGPEAATGVPAEQSPILDRTLDNPLKDRLPELVGSAVARSVTTFTPFRAEVMDVIGPGSRNDVTDYRSLRDRGFAGAIEIRVTHIGFAGWGSEGISLFVTAEARLLDTQRGNPTWLRGLVYESPTHTFSRWMREDAALTRVELERAYRTLGERIVDVLFLSTEPSGNDGGNTSDTCGVALLEPKPVLELGPQNRQRPAAPPVASLTPTLVWSAAPLAPKMVNPNPWATDRSIRYDLRIWKAEADAPGIVAYERLGLAGTRHQVEVPLEPATTYFWSVRMRGTVDGHVRAVPWSQSSTPPVFSKPFLRQARFDAVVTGDAVKLYPCRLDSSVPCGCLDYIPADNFYRFRTP
jgi:hypothetical protein